MLSLIYLNIYLPVSVILMYSLLLSVCLFVFFLNHIKIRSSGGAMALHVKDGSRGYLAHCAQLESGHLIC